jgi:5-methylthioadenosine/S-adenosylhomocysteine deaminase
MTARRLSARWLLPADRPAVEHGALLIGPHGRIAAVGPEPDVPRPAGVALEEFGDAVLLPGLINTHTHLELTGLEGEPPGHDFADWIRRLREAKAARAPEAYLDAARRGLADCLAAGVTTVADTGDSGAVIQALAEAGGSGIAYQEVFGPHPDQREASLAALRQRVEHLRRFVTERVRIGVSPHAPYSVSGPLYAATSEWARREALPIAVHLAESPAESALLERGTGPFSEAWRGRGIPLPLPPGRTPVAWLEEHGVLSDRTLCIHVVQAGPGDVARLARTGASVAHCPLSNHAHGHGAAPLGAFLAAGIRVGLGTDSTVSVGRLDLLAEARAARVLGGLDAARALALCTLEGARALGLEAEIGSLAPGKWCDCAVIRPPHGAAGSPPEEQVLAIGPRDVLATFLGGRNVHRTSRVP